MDTIWFCVEWNVNNPMVISDINRQHVVIVDARTGLFESAPKSPSNNGYKGGKRLDSLMYVTAGDFSFFQGE